MRFFAILLLLIMLPACEDIFGDSNSGASSDSDYYYENDGADYDSSATYTITVVSERYDVVEVRLDNEFKGNLIKFGSKIEIKASGGEHTIEFWGAVGGLGEAREDVLIASETFVLNEDIVITIKPLGDD